MIRRSEALTEATARAGEGQAARGNVSTCLQFYDTTKRSQRQDCVETARKLRGMAAQLWQAADALAGREEHDHD